MKKFAKSFKWIFFLYFIFYISFNFIAKNPNLTVRYMGWKPYVVLSTSMEPVLHKGDVVIATWKDPKLLSTGDIIVTTPRKNLGVIHYFAGTEVRDNKLYIRTRKYRAINKKDWDYWKLTYDQYVGCSSIRIPWIGNIFIFLSTPLGFIVLLIIALLLLLLF